MCSSASIAERQIDIVNIKKLFLSGERNLSPHSFSSFQFLGGLYHTHTSTGASDNMEFNTVLNCYISKKEPGVKMVFFPLVSVFFL